SEDDTVPANGSRALTQTSFVAGGTVPRSTHDHPSSIGDLLLDHSKRIDEVLVSLQPARLADEALRRVDVCHEPPKRCLASKAQLAAQHASLPDGKTPEVRPVVR